MFSTTGSDALASFSYTEIICYVYLSIIVATAITWIIFFRSRGRFLLAASLFPQCFNTVRLAVEKWDKYLTGEDSSDDNYFWRQVWTAFAVVHFLAIIWQYSMCCKDIERSGQIQIHIQLMISDDVAPAG